MPAHRRLAGLVLTLALLAVACSSGDSAVPAGSTTDDPATAAEDDRPPGSGGCSDVPAPGAGPVERPWAGPGPELDAAAVWPADPRAGVDRRWKVEVVAEVPHDASAFTQGLEFVRGRLLESTGCRGRSALREIDPATGDVVAATPMPPDWFGEGITRSRSGGELIQLTWQAGIARRLDPAGLGPVGEFTYEGEGWGICSLDDTLVMSNGSATLTMRHPFTFGEVAAVAVERDSAPVAGLNELECIDGLVLANVFRTDEIVVIDPDTGAVAATIDAAAVRAEIGATRREEVLNGIAAVGDGTLLLGGKHWPRHFVVRLVVE